MKKIIFFICAFLCSINVAQAANHIYNIDIDVYIDEKGNANITENWTVKGSDGTEWYKDMGYMEDMELRNFKVSMDGQPLTYKKNWDINDSLNEKKGYYGVYKENNIELCFGKYDYKKHVFTLNYTLTNFVFNVDDAQVIYFTFINRLTDVDFEDYSLEIKTFYDIPDTTDVWSFGHKGYAYVKDGKIQMSNEGDVDEDYVVLLAKFPLNTFKTTNKTDYKTFNDVYKAAEEGSYLHDYNDFDLSEFLGVLLILSTYGGVIFAFIKKGQGKKYSYLNDKKITKENTPYFRDIPCNKNIYYANTLSLLNKWSSNETNILGAILLKWIKNGVVTVNKINDKNISLVLNNPGKIDNTLESELYDMIYKASKDGILENKELEKWAKNNYNKFLDLFKKINKQEIERLEKEGHIFKRENKEQGKYKNIMDDTLYEEGKKLYGLKLFLDEFSNIKQREAIEVSLWDEYLMYAYIFGSAKKVMQQFKDLYPEILQEMNNYNLDFDTFIILNNISISSSSAASSARSAAQSYSAGGGGFSRGGGGGGSFGGGGGGGSR